MKEKCSLYYFNVKTVNCYIIQTTREKAFQGTSSKIQQSQSCQTHVTIELTIIFLSRSINKIQKRKRQEKIDTFFKRNPVSEVESWTLINVDIKQQQPITIIYFCINLIYYFSSFNKVCQYHSLIPLSPCLGDEVAGGISLKRERDTESFTGEQ